jgi:phosphatidylserine decarboxylase
MEDTILGIALSLLIIVPLAIKWELPMEPVVPAAIAIGIVSGILAHVFSLLFFMTLAGRAMVTMSLIIIIALSTLMARFYRDPERVRPQPENCIVSPADGIVKYVKPVTRDAPPLSAKGDDQIVPPSDLLGILPGGKGYLVGIAMSFLDVHVTRAPIGGTITSMQHIPGTFLSLKRADAAHKNERLNQVIENENYRVGLIHIASRLVRQIVSYVDKGDSLVSGQRIGMIKFGSQVDIILPDYGQLEISIRVGDRVVAGETILATCLEMSTSSEGRKEDASRSIS